MSISTGSRGKWLRPVALAVCWIAFLAAMAGLLVAYDLRTLVNADHYQLAALFHDLTSWGGRVSEWALSNAPYFFPDIPLYFLAAALLHDLTLALMAAAVLQVLLHVAGWVLLFGRLSEDPGTRLFMQMAAILVAATILTRAVELGIWSLTMVSHFGVIVTAPYVLLGAVMGLRASTRRSLHLSLAGLAGLSFLLAISDLFFLAWVAGPLAVALALLWWIDRVPLRRMLALQAALAGAALAGVLAARLLLPPSNLGLFLANRPGTITGSIGTFAAWMVEWAPRNRFPVASGLSALLLHAGMLLYAVRRLATGRALSPAAVLLSAFVLISSMACGFLALAGRLFVDVTSHRYLLPVFFLPLSTLPALFLWLPVVRGRVRGATLLAAAALAALLVAANVGPLSHVDSLRRYAGYYPDVAACLDREAAARGLHNGMATYWDAKYLAALSRQDLRLVQVTPVLEPFAWVTNVMWYERFEPQFAITYGPDAPPGQMSSTTVVERFGEPSASFRCADRTVLVYDRPGDQAFRTLLHDYPRLQARRTGG